MKRDIKLYEPDMQRFLKGEIAIVADLMNIHIVRDYCKHLGFVTISKYHCNGRYNRCLIHIVDNIIYYRYYDTSIPINFSDYCMVICGLNSLIVDETTIDTINYPSEKSLTRAIVVSQDSIESGLKSLLNDYVKTRESNTSDMNNALCEIYKAVFTMLKIDVNKLSGCVDEVEISR